MSRLLGFLIHGSMMCQVCLLVWVCIMFEPVQIYSDVGLFNWIIWIVLILVFTCFWSFRCVCLPKAGFAGICWPTPTWDYCGVWLRVWHFHHTSVSDVSGCKFTNSPFGDRPRWKMMETECNATSSCYRVGSGPLEPTSDPQVAERVHQLYSFDIDHEMVGNAQQSRSSELILHCTFWPLNQFIHQSSFSLCEQKLLFRRKEMLCRACSVERPPFFSLLLCNALRTAFSKAAPRECKTGGIEFDTTGSFVSSNDYFPWCRWCASLVPCSPQWSDICCIAVAMREGAWCRGHWLWLGHFCWCCPIDEHPSLRGRVWSRSLVISLWFLCVFWCIVMHCLHMSALCICCVSSLFIFVHCGSLPEKFSDASQILPGTCSDAATGSRFAETRRSNLRNPLEASLAILWQWIWKDPETEVLSCPVMSCHHLSLA